MQIEAVRVPPPAGPSKGHRTRPPFLKSPLKGVRTISEKQKPLDGHRWDLGVTVIESKANTNTQLVLTALVLLTGSKYDMQR